MHTFIDLFAGIGGFRVALERKGMKCIFSSEIDKEARISYKKTLAMFLKVILLKYLKAVFLNTIFYVLGFPVKHSA